MVQKMIGVHSLYLAGPAVLLPVNGLKVELARGRGGIPRIFQKSRDGDGVVGGKTPPPGSPFPGLVEKSKI